MSRRIRDAFVAYPDWRRSEAALRELRKQVTFAVVAETEDVDAVARLVEQLFAVLARAGRT